MPVQPKPKRTEFKTRKEYRFAIKKQKREIQKQPIVIISAVVLALVMQITNSAGAAILSAIGAAILFAVISNKYRHEATPTYNVSCPTCHGAVIVPAGKIKCPKCSAPIIVTPN
jgi:predicted histidine transporter YuiF (NhaC family)